MISPSRACHVHKKQEYNQQKSLFQFFAESHHDQPRSEFCYWFCGVKTVIFLQSFLSIIYIKSSERVLSAQDVFNCIVFCWQLLRMVWFYLRNFLGALVHKLNSVCRNCTFLPLKHCHSEDKWGNSVMIYCGTTEPLLVLFIHIQCIWCYN